MQNRNEICPKNILPFALTAFLFFFGITAVKSKDHVSQKHFFSGGINNSGPQLISSKENIFSVSKKQKFSNDSIPIKNNISVDSSQVKNHFSKDSVPAFQNISGDSIPGAKNDSLERKDSVTKSADTIHYNLAKNALEAPVDYSAEDSMVIDVAAKTVTLYGNKVTTNYKDNKLTGPIIAYDESSGDIIATGKRDKIGRASCRERA